MVVVPVVNVIFLITLNSAIPLFNNSSNLVITNSSHELSPLAWPPTDGDCRRKATCVSHNATCFGVPLPYMETSTDVVSNLFQNHNLANFRVLEQDLQRWESLRKIPKCWSILQPFLCALYMPKCEQEAVYLLTQKRCRYTMSTCKVLREQPFASIFPPINCDDMKYFSGTCKHDVKDPKSNITGECVPPLIQTGDAKSEYDVVTGCGVQCQDPLYTEDEHDLIHGRIAWIATISLLSNLFAVVTFIIDWPSANKYPALIIFYINICFVISNMGWLVQFFPNAREDIVCKKDMTLRRFQPSQGESLSCVIVFIIIYYFIMAAIVWFVILTYAWHLWFRALGKIQERVDKKGAYFHLVAWSLPAVLTIVTMASGQIEGNSVAGICFVRSSHWGARVALLLVPIAAAVFISGYYLSRGILFLYRIKKDSQQILSEKASSKIREMIIRIMIFYFFCVSFVFMTFLFHLYEFSSEESWQKSFRNYIFCLILQSKSEPRECEIDSKPNSAFTQLHLLIMFAAGINMSSWVWTRSALYTWKRFFNSLYRKIGLGYTIKTERFF
ncbi:UNVERIFIED_CONTAM: hypothetical protein PYX00_002782 [Menopon gallinae]|uniref:Uncharacterized protein n=1 Tax=Menopon gallinae TaxID=328185 RepID=A0AAW2HXH3_9NEOP